MSYARCPCALPFSTVAVRKQCYDPALHPADITLEWGLLSTSLETSPAPSPVLISCEGKWSASMRCGSGGHPRGRNLGVCSIVRRFGGTAELGYAHSDTMWELETYCCPLHGRRWCLMRYDSLPTYTFVICFPSPTYHGDTKNTISRVLGWMCLARTPRRHVAAARNLTLSPCRPLVVYNSKQFDSALVDDNHHASCGMWRQRWQERHSK